MNQNNVIYPLEDGIGLVELIEHSGSDASIVRSARVSFAGDLAPFDIEKDAKLIKYLLANKHLSPFEHNLITFRVKCPIHVDRQWVRHRVGVSKNETSQRYTEAQEECYTPSTFRKQAKSNRQASVVDKDELINQDEANKLYQIAWQTSFLSYQALLELGVAREQARGVLPLALYTSSYYTFNLRSLFHFLELRDSSHAQYEMQKYAQALATLAEPLFPVAFAAWNELRGEKHD